MDLYKEILLNKLERINPDEMQLDRIVEMECYKALKKIKAVLEDEACFMKIEQIVCALEEIGSDGGNRHDFR